MRQSNWFILEFELLEYRRALALQEEIVRLKAAGEISENVLLILEHPPVFTLGYRGGLDNLKVSPQELEKRQIETVATRRGGDITYHGPGQIILYPIITLRGGSWSIPRYIELLEETMLITAQGLGVMGQRSARNHGIWYGAKKMGSVGIAVRRGIAYHGLALNVSPDLTPFSWINPCGLKDLQTTSIAQELGKQTPISKARDKIRQNFGKLFQLQSLQEPPPKLAAYLESLPLEGATRQNIPDKQL